MCYICTAPFLMKASYVDPLNDNDAAQSCNHEARACRGRPCPEAAVVGHQFKHEYPL